MCIFLFCVFPRVFLRGHKNKIKMTNRFCLFFAWSINSGTAVVPEKDTQGGREGERLGALLCVIFYLQFIGSWLIVTAVVADFFFLVRTVCGSASSELALTVCLRTAMIVCPTSRGREGDGACKVTTARLVEENASMCYVHVRWFRLVLIFVWLGSGCSVAVVPVFLNGAF